MKVLISGGGTGGHIFPALAIANALRRRDPETEILFVGAQGRMEMDRVPAAGYDIEGLPVAGFDRKRPWRNIPVLFKLAKSLAKAHRILSDFRPDIAIGVGGYASGPMLREAQRRGVPTLLQEQNSYPGVTNKLLAKKAKAICVAYGGTERWFPQELIRMTGNPVRSSLGAVQLNPQQAKAKLGFDPSRPLVVVVGGSLGARTVNQAVERLLSLGLPQGAQLLWQTGKLYYDEYSPKAQGHPEARIVPFIDDMDLAYAAADLMVARAGACTISELQDLGKPSVLIPSPNVAEDHQRHNAQALASRNAAVMVLDAEAVDKLPGAVADLLADDARRHQLSLNARAMALRGADEKIVDTVYEILGIPAKAPKSPQTPDKP